MIIPEANRLAPIQEYYFARKLRDIRARMAAGEDIINLGIGSPDLPPSDATLKRLISQAVEPGHHGYQPYKGIAPLRQAVADWYFRTYGVSLDPQSEILPLMGSKEGIMHASMAFLNPGDQVLVPNPGYPTYRANAILVGAEVLEYELKAENGWYPDLETLARKDLSRVKMMWVNYPHMPTGALPSEAVFQQLISFAREHKILLCHDNPYSLILNPNPFSVLRIPGASEVAIELNSLSKSHNMAGWRIGMLAGAAPYLKAVLKVKSNMDSGMFYPLQQAAIAALNNSYSWHRQQNETYAGRRKIGTRLLEALGCELCDGQGGMFLWARIPDHQTSGEAFSDHLLQESQVFLTPGFIFGTQGDRYLRLSLCTAESRLMEALDRVLELQLTRA